MISLSMTNLDSISRVHGRQDLVYRISRTCVFSVDETLLQDIAYMRSLVDKTLLQNIACMRYFLGRQDLVTEYRVHAFFRSTRPCYSISRTCVFWSTRPCYRISRTCVFSVDETLLQYIAYMRLFGFGFTRHLSPILACLGTPCCQSTRFQSTCVKSSFVLSPVLLHQLLTCVWHRNLLRVSRRVEGCECRT